MYQIAPGSTSRSVQFYLRDATTGQPKTGLAWNSSGAVAAYVRANGSAAPITLATLSGPTAAWSGGGFVEIDATNAKGLYRLDLPDAALATGVPFVTVTMNFTGVLGEAALILLQSPSSLAGPGAIQWTVNVQAVGGAPLAGASVWVTTDLAGTNVIAGTLVTNSSGQAVFTLNAGTFYLWVSDSGYSGTNPTTFTVA